MTQKIKIKIAELAQVWQKTAKEWEKVPPQQKRNIEKEWDIEHAYYSATLEGNGLDKKRFNELAKKIK